MDRKESKPAEVPQVSRVASRLVNGVGAAMFFGAWGAGAGLLLGVLIGGLLFSTMKDGGMVLAGGPIVGACVGAVLGTLFGLITGASDPALADRLANHPVSRQGGPHSRTAEERSGTAATDTSAVAHPDDPPSDR